MFTLDNAQHHTYINFSEHDPEHKTFNVIKLTTDSLQHNQTTE